MLPTPGFGSEVVSPGVPSLPGPPYWIEPRLKVARPVCLFMERDKVQFDFMPSTS